MSIVILDVPQAEADTHEMDARPWLSLAIREYHENTTVKMVHGSFSADGFRMHYAPGQPPCECGSDKSHDALNKLITDAHKNKFAFTINRRYLIEALAGMNPEDDQISFYIGNDTPEKSGVLIETNDGRCAFIMPMHGEAYEKRGKNDTHLD